MAAVIQNASVVNRHPDAVPLTMVHVPCPICGAVDGEPVAVGEDFEYRTSPDAFIALVCRSCGLVRLDPRPASSELARIYPNDYHAFNFTEESFGLVHRVRQRIEARRLLRAASKVPPTGHILDVGCGDGFHLDLLRRFGSPQWTLQGIDLDARAVGRALQRGLDVRCASAEASGLPAASFDLVLLIQTIEHVADPVDLLRAVHDLLRPGGRVVVVTDNTGSLDFQLSKGRHWGGYHFPRHWNLFDRHSLRLAGERAGLEVESISTMVSPVNWTYSVRNRLSDLGAPKWMVDRFSLSSPITLAGFTAFDAVQHALGRGALLCATARRSK